VTRKFSVLHSTAFCIMADTFDRGVVAGSGVVLAAFVSLMGVTKRQLTAGFKPVLFQTGALADFPCAAILTVGLTRMVDMPSAGPRALTGNIMRL